MRAGAVSLPRQGPAVSWGGRARGRLKLLADLKSAKRYVLGVLDARISSRRTNQREENVA